MNTIKHIVKHDSSIITEVVHCLICDLSSKKGSVRLKLLHIIDALFIRSAAFRTALCYRLKDVVAASGAVQSFGSTVPVDHVPEVRALVLRLIEIWNVRFGGGLPQLRAMSRFLRESTDLAVPDIREEMRRAEAMRLESQRRKATLYIARARKSMREITSQWEEIASTMETLEQCFIVLFPPMEAQLPDASVPDEEDAESDWEDGYTSTVGQESLSGNKRGSASLSSLSPPGKRPPTMLGIAQEAGMGGIDYTLEVTIPESLHGVGESYVVLDTVRDHSKQLAAHTLPRLKRWKDSLTALDELESTADVSIDRDSASAMLCKVSQMIARIEDTLSSRCNALLGENVLQASL